MIRYAQSERIAYQRLGSNVEKCKGRGTIKVMFHAMPQKTSVSLLFDACERLLRPWIRRQRPTVDRPRAHARTGCSG